MTRPVTLSLTDGTKVVVPDSLDLITPYVLQEQGDWFEDELRFLRRLMRPGDQMIDVGANYGVYALSLARTVGPKGQVWAFEPASGTARILADSVAANGLTQLVLDQRALSSGSGTARLGVNANSELNAIVRADVPSAQSEVVTLTTLDACMNQYGWRDIRVVKIDAEGEESRILEGGAKFFQTLSPLVLYEVKAGDTWHLDLRERFKRMGYRSYRLVPGLKLIVPFGDDEDPDVYLLNLFACKHDRAAELAAEGWLVDHGDGAGDGPDLDRPFSDPRYSWSRAFAEFPFAARLDMSASAESTAGVMVDILALYACSHDRSQPAAVRLGAMERALRLLLAACQAQPSPARLSTLARVAREHGSRYLAVQVIQQLLSAIDQDADLQFRSPFLPPCERFDGIPPEGRPREWLLASALEAFEKQSSFSSYYTGASARPRLELIQRLGWAGGEMTRRLELVHARNGAHSR